jgi:hypothetical protein
MYVYAILMRSALSMVLQEEIDRFEDEVIRGGPVALPGALELVQKVRTSGGHREGHCVDYG